MSNPLRLAMWSLAAAAVLWALPGCKKEEKKKAVELKVKVEAVTADERAAARQAVQNLWSDGQVAARVAAFKPAPQQTDLYRDLVVLTRHPHRLAGFGAAATRGVDGKDVTTVRDLPGSLWAGEYVANRLKDMGVEFVFTQSVPVAQCDAQAAMEVDGQPHPVYAMRPNLLQAVVTPPEGLTGTTVYAGGGDFREYRDSPNERIVVLDYAADNWLPAFAMGAKAVIFVGGPEAAFNPHHHVNLPANLPRFYVPTAAAPEIDAEAAKGLKDLEFWKQPRRVTLRATGEWKMLQARSVIGVLRGTKPLFDQKKPEAILLSAPLDSLSEVPALSRGARGAGNVAALLHLAEHILNNRPRRDVILCFFDGETADLESARAFYGSLYRSRGRPQERAKTTLDERLEMFEEEKTFIRDIQDVLAKGNVFAGELAGMPGWRDAGELMLRESRGLVGVTRDELQKLRLTRLRHETALVKMKARIDKKDSPPWFADPAANVPPVPNKHVEDFTALEHREAWWRLNREIARLETEAEIRSQLLRRVMAREYPDVPREGSPEEQALAREVLKRYDVLLAEVVDVCRRRQEELAESVECTRQGKVLSEAVGEKKDLIVLHLAVNLGDASGRWAFIHGDNSRGDLGDVDDVGQYTGGIFRAIEAVAGESDLAGRLPLLERRTVDGLHDVRMFAPGRYAHSGSVAAIFGVPNLALMTPIDRLVRDGHPTDLVDRYEGDGAGRAARRQLRFENTVAALGEIAPFLRRLADSEMMSLKSSIAATSVFSESEFSRGKYKGATALMLAGGSPMPDRAARGALVALVGRGTSTNLWGGLPVADLPGGYRPFPISRVDVNGNFEMPPISRTGGTQLLFAALLDQRGNIEYVTNQETVAGKPPLTARQTVLFRAEGMTAVGLGYQRRGIATMALKAASTSPLNVRQSLTCENENIFTVYAWWGTHRVKIFNKEGMAVLGNEDSEDPQVGDGRAIRPFEHWPVVEMTADELARLNLKRRDTLKEHKILELSLEELGAEARELREKRDAIPAAKVERRVGTAAAAAEITRREYGPLLSVLNDLVIAVVLLLLLSIPFAYGMERLLIGTPHIYRQICWFVVFFLLTFVTLFVVNPAFSIAATPIIIFLAFGIILLSTLVIIIMTRKLQAEVRRMQGMGTTVHTADVSRLGTMMAAVQMGISTMRRRPVRTLLTAATVVLLTFTILTFASFTSSWGTRRTSVGPLSGPPRVVVRHPFWGTVSDDTPELLAGALGEEATVVPRYWVALTAGQTEAYMNANRERRLMIAAAEAAPGERKPVASVRALVGVDVRDARAMPDLRELLGGDIEALAGNGVFLTADLAGEGGLGLRPGEKCFVAGVECTLAGFVDRRKVTTYRMLEGSSVLPVDYETSAGGKVASFKAQETRAATDIPETQSAQFVSFGPDQVAFVSAELARKLGGRLVSFAVHPAAGTDVEKLARRVAKITALPTYVGAAGGVERLFFTSLTRASGLKDLMLPVVLGGLIIFATMLGSVSDREKEIYAFSALGLAPPHVASLFFAEASVYAVVGGMGGYLLGQIVARLLTLLSGWVAVPTMNYSSTNAVVTILIVMCTVLVSTIFPAVRASRSANPGIQRSWRIGRPAGDLYDIVFPFTVSSYDITGVVSFLAEHFRNFSDTALGSFASREVEVFRQDGEMLGMRARVALAPFDLGVSQKFAMLAQPSEIEGIEEIRILLVRRSGTRGDWQRANRVFINELRKQLLIWRSVAPEVMERYRRQTLEQWNVLPVEEVRPETFGETA